MSKPETVEVPFSTLPDGRKCITDQQLTEHQYLRDFVRRFPDCFSRDFRYDAVILCESNTSFEEVK